MEPNLTPVRPGKQSRFQKAERQHAKLKLAITGPSGAGKTMSALKIATGLALEFEKLTGTRPRIAVVDTENKSSALYADKFDFELTCIAPPFTIDKYRDCIQDAIREGFGILILDTISHAWAGEGGLLQKKDALDAANTKAQFNAWGPIGKEHEAFKSWMLQSDVHLIATMRSKQDYILEERNGKQVPKKVGMAPIQRDGMEYEFTSVLDLAMNHEASASKDRTSLFDGKMFVPDENTGVALVDWLLKGKPIEPRPSTEQLADVWKKLTSPPLKKNKVDALKWLSASIGKPSSEWTLSEYSLVAEKLALEIEDAEFKAAQATTSGGGFSSFTEETIPF